MEQSTQEKFEHFAIVDLFGHLKIAGLVTEATIGGCSLLRVDVPAIGEQPAYTRYFGQAAIYSLTPVSEEIMRSALEYIRPRPVETYMLPAPAAPSPAPDAVRPGEIDRRSILAENVPYSNDDNPDGDFNDYDDDGDFEDEDDDFEDEDENPF
jgi:hypothetical protein